MEPENKAGAHEDFFLISLVRLRTPGAMLFAVRAGISPHAQPLPDPFSSEFNRTAASKGGPWSRHAVPISTFQREPARNYVSK